MQGHANSGDRPALTQRFGFAGKPLLVRSNSAEILRHAASFFTQLDDCAPLGSDSAVVTLVVNNQCGAEPADAPLFRGRGHFAMARFTSDDVAWFNLRARRAFGTFSRSTANNQQHWHKHILPAIAGILAPVLDVTPVHAACLAKNDRGILLAAPSGAGKSTLAVALAQMGYRFLADEWTYLAEQSGELRAWSLPVPIKLLPDAIRFLPELAQYKCTKSLNGEIAFEVSAEGCFSLTRAEHCSIQFITLLERSTRHKCSIVTCSPAKAMEQITREIEPLVGSMESTYRRQLELLTRLSGAACFELKFNAHPQTVAIALDRLLTRALDGEHASPPGTIADMNTDGIELPQSWFSTIGEANGNA